MSTCAPPQESIEQRIRTRGAVLDMPFTQAIYQPLLQQQRRDGVEVERDLTYGQDARQKVDVYRPLAHAAQHRTAMIFMPGGGFIRGDKSERENVGQYFARHGIVVAVANYRLAPAHTWPAGALDVISVFEWLKKNAPRYGVDGTRVFLAGESAGAAHVAAAMLIRRFHPPGGLSAAGGMLISGVYNVRLEKLARAQFGIATPDPRNEAYFGSDFTRYPAMSTIDLIDAAAFPLMITFAEIDLLQMQIQAGELFARLVTNHGFAPQLGVVRGHNHLTQVYAVNTGDESLSAPMLKFLS
jgi:acetyl esterase